MGVKIKKRVKFSILIILILIISISSSAFDIISPFLPQQNQVQVESIKLNVSELKLADKINGKSINSSYGKIYLKRYKEFKDIKFSKLEKVENRSLIIKHGDLIDIKGLIFNNAKYGIHLVGCDKRTCNFRVNGVLYKDVSNEFDINNDLKVKIKSITLDYCGHVEICDDMFDPYDKVELEIVIK